jgi:hypothetical protein
MMMRRSNSLSIEGNLDVLVPDFHFVVSVVLGDSGVWAILQVILGVSSSLVEHDSVIEITKSVLEGELALLWIERDLKMYPFAINTFKETLATAIVALEFSISEVKHDGST